MPTITIDQAGNAAGVADSSRSDGFANGALVTITFDDPGLVNTITLLWVPRGDYDAVSTLQQTAIDTWTFSPTALAYGTYRILPVVDGVEGTPRTFGIRTPSAGLRIPALNERASDLASLVNGGAVYVALSECNEISAAPFGAGNYGGWFETLDELYRAVEDISAASITGPGLLGTTDKAIALWSGVNGDTLINSLFRIDPAGTLTSSVAMTITTDAAAVGLGLSITGGAANGLGDNAGGSLTFTGGNPTGIALGGSVTHAGADNATSVGAGVNLRGGRGSAAANDGGIVVKRVNTSNRATRLQFEGGNAALISLKAPAAPVAHEWTLPSAQGAAGTFLQNNGSGVLSWAAAGLTVLNEGVTLSTAVTSIDFVGLDINATGAASVVVTVASIGGTTASRPVTPAQYTRYFDTTLGLPIWYYGVLWYNAAGVSV